MFKSIFCILSFLLLCILMSSFLFSANISSSRFSSIAKLVKSHIGGRVINNSGQAVTVYEWRHSHIVAAHQDSRDLSFKDIDAIKIEKSTIIDGKLYNTGLLKFCDTGTIQISDTTYHGQPARQYSVSPGGNLCKLLSDFEVYHKIEEAMPFER